MLQPRRVARPAGVAPRLVGAPTEPEPAPKPAQAPPAMVVPPEVRLTINRFLLFLRNRQLNMTKLLELPTEKQNKLRMEFLRIKDTPEVLRPPAQLDKIHIVTADEKKHFAYVKKAEAAIAFLESNNFFLHEINTALRYTRSRTKSNEIIGGVAVDKFPDTLEDVGTTRQPSDLEQNIYLELIEATVKYEKKMSGALAHKIATNLIAEFVGRKIRESRKKVELDNVQIDNGGNEEEINGFEQKMTVSNDTVGRHDIPTMDGVGPGIPTSSWGWGEAVDRGHKVIAGGNRTDGKERGGAVAAGPLPELMETKRPELEALVRKYHGTKRKVGEILLSKGDTLVRGIPGIPKSTVWLIRKQILEEFRKILGVNKPFKDLELPTTDGHS